MITVLSTLSDLVGWVRKRGAAQEPLRCQKELSGPVSVFDEESPHRQQGVLFYSSQPADKVVDGGLAVSVVLQLPSDLEFGGKLDGIFKGRHKIATAFFRHLCSTSGNVM